MRARIWGFFTNPIIIIVPLVVGSVLLWQQFTRSEQVMMQGNTPPKDAVEIISSASTPKGWQMSKHGTLNAAVSESPGLSNNQAVMVRVADYHSGGVTAASPATQVQAGETYYYKGFYKSTTSFDLLARYTYHDGSSKLLIVGSYPEVDHWTTASAVFIADAAMSSVQYEYHMTSGGDLQLDKSFITPAPKNVYVKPPIQLGDHLIPNPEFDSVNGRRPNKWTKYAVGESQNTLAYVAQSASEKPYIHAAVTAYKDGEVKWQYSPMSVTPGQRYQFELEYRSDARPDVVAEYVLSSGKRQFVTLDALPPTTDWTTYTTKFEVPPNAVNMFVTAVLHGNGAMDSRQYALYNITIPGELTWKHPSVSFTFDDGWNSDYVTGASLLDSFGYPGTFYINPSSIDTNKSFMNSTQVNDLQSRGHELASHAYEHRDLNTLSQEALDHQLGFARDYFATVLKKTATDFASPYGRLNPEGEYAARKYYASARSTDTGINTRQNFDPYNLLVYYVTSDTPTSSINDILAETKASNGWLILVYHRLEPVRNSKTAISPALFRKHLEMVQQQGLTVQTVSEALQEVKS